MKKDRTRKLFGYPSCERVNRIVKAFSGEYEDITIKDKKSVLPKWLLEKGVANMYDILKSRKDLKEDIEYFSKDKKDRLDKWLLKNVKEELRKFRIEYFQASDVEKFFRDILDKYELVEKDRIIRPNPRDIGKKHFVCDSCGWTAWTKVKPKYCKKCKKKKISRYYRM